VLNFFNTKKRVKISLLQSFLLQLTKGQFR